MPPLIVWIFLLFASLFASVHRIASVASLYWYYPWFDVFMHFWGGVLVVVGIVALTSLQAITIKPTLKLVLQVLFVAMISWEIFERFIGLYATQGYIIDTMKDIIVGLVGGLVGYALFVKKDKSV